MSPRNGVHVAVVGAGPAGLACAGELAARGFDVVVYDAHDEVGRDRSHGDRAVPAGASTRCPQSATRSRGSASTSGFGARIESAERAARDRRPVADAVFLGVGLGADRALDCPGADLAGFWQSLDFVAALKHGEAPSVGERVVVLGGGNTAIDVARESVRLGAER